MRGLGLRRQHLSDEIYAELVDILFSAMTALISMAVAVTGIGALMFAITGDPAVAVLTLVSLIVTVLRAVLNLAYRRRRASVTLARAEVEKWETAFGAGTTVAALLVGLLNARVLIIGDVTTHMLAVALTFGFCAGAVIRLSVRPRVVALTLIAVTAPTLFGFIAHLQLKGDHLALAYGGQAAFLSLFVLSAIEMVRHLYRSTLLQLTTKAELAHLARQDPLTGLANRISLREEFDREMAKLHRSGDFIALHFLDLDRFKAVNDNHGHPTGDALLKSVAARLVRVLRAGDTAARLGGDEFVVLQAHIRDPGEADMLARRIVKEISAPYSINGTELNIGASVGVALAPSDGVDLDELAAHGDAALYQSKTTRRGSVSFWQSGACAPKGLEQTQGDIAIGRGARA